MGNYIKENLIAIPSSAVPAGTLAMKVGNDEIFTPGNICISSGGQMDFYKCASVDTASETWSGYLAVLGENGLYSFADTVTEGLTYGTAYIPYTGNVYNSDTTVIVSKNIIK